MAQIQVKTAEQVFKVLKELAAPYRATLIKLQAAAPPLPAKTVHQAIRKDGPEVAVKVQYPGAEEVLISDLNQIQRFAKEFALFMPGLDRKPLLDELRVRIVEEVDYEYEYEAEAQRHYAKIFAGIQTLRFRSYSLHRNKPWYLPGWMTHHSLKLFQMEREPNEIALA